MSSQFSSFPQIWALNHFHHQGTPLPERLNPESERWTIQFEADNKIQLINYPSRTKITQTILYISTLLESLMTTTEGEWFKRRLSRQVWHERHKLTWKWTKYFFDQFENIENHLKTHQATGYRPSIATRQNMPTDTLTTLILDGNNWKLWNARLWSAWNGRTHTKLWLALKQNQRTHAAVLRQPIPAHEPNSDYSWPRRSWSHKRSARHYH